MPALQRAYEQLHRQGITILGIDAIGEDAPTITAYSNPLGVTYPLLLDPTSQVTRLYRVQTTPTSFFIDRQGIVRAVHVGPLTTDDIRNGLTSLL